MLATGWTGRAIAEAVLVADDPTLGSAVSRSSAGRTLGRAWGGEPNEVPVFGSVDEALEGADVLIDYTSHDAVRGNSMAAIGRRVPVVIGSSGLTADDFAEIADAAQAQGIRVAADTTSP